MTAQTDLNDYISTGMFYFTPSYTPTNIPIGSNGYLIVIAMNSTTVKQLWFRAGTQDSNDWHTCVRTMVGGEWGSWKRYITNADLITNSVTKSNITITANSNTGGNGSISVSRSGYTPLAVSGWALVNTSSGSNASRCLMSQCYLDGNTLYYNILNTYTSDANINITFYVLYAAS